MRPVFIVVEGPTEKEFIDECLKPHWSEQYSLYDVQVRILGKPGAKGGDVRVARLRTDVEILLKQRPDAFVTTMLDYYGNRLKKGLTNHDICQALPDAEQRITCLEKELYNLVGSQRFIPYLQKYEFESLLFSSGKSLGKYLTEKSCLAIDDLRKQSDGAEEINTLHPPSYRLIEITQKHEPLPYGKTTDGSILALEIGLPIILQECPRFAAWVERIGELAEE